LRDHDDDLEEVYTVESDAAVASGDMDSAWGWMAKVRFPHYSLMPLLDHAKSTFECLLPVSS